MLCEGTGEANRAVDAALGIGLPAKRPRIEPGEDGEEAIGTGRGCVEDEPSLGADMVGFLLLDRVCLLPLWLGWVGG